MPVRKLTVFKNDKKIHDCKILAKLLSFIIKLKKPTSVVTFVYIGYSLLRSSSKQ